jgi:hypothetical protein
MPASDARWKAETVRLYRRYEVEIVGSHALCPWAGPVRRDGRISETVLIQEGLEVEPSLEAIDALDRHVDLALLIYPRLGVERAAFDQFAARVRDAEVARRSLGAAPFVFAVFHPEASPQLGDPERLIPFLRRTPDPTLQLLRSTTLDQARGTAAQGTQFVDVRDVGSLVPQPVSLRERIAKTNLETTLRVGVDRLAEKLEDIIRDREATHRALLSES